MCRLEQNSNSRSTRKGNPVKHDRWPNLFWRNVIPHSWQNQLQFLPFYCIIVWNLFFIPFFFPITVMDIVSTLSSLSPSESKRFLFLCHSLTPILSCAPPPTGGTFQSAPAVFWGQFPTRQRDLGRGAVERFRRRCVNVPDSFWVGGLCVMTVLWFLILCASSHNSLWPRKWIKAADFLFRYIVAHMQYFVQNTNFDRCANHQYLVTASCLITNSVACLFPFLFYLSLGMAALMDMAVGTVRKY